jgi:prepilin-type N-terminal cleavage/methylation domain-containing protein
MTNLHVRLQKRISRVGQIKNSLVRGFTLIELLVTISIIGLLSTIILASLRTVRTRANDAKVEAQLSNFKSAAELYYNSTGHNTYGIPVAGGPNGSMNGSIQTIGNGCNTGMFTDPNISKFMLASNYPAYDVGTGKCTVPADSGSYAVSAQLSNGTFWCVDSKGHAQSVAVIQGDNGDNCFAAQVS